MEQVMDLNRVRITNLMDRAEWRAVIGGVCLTSRWAVWSAAG